MVDSGADGQQDGEDGLDHGTESTPGGLDVPETKKATYFPTKGQGHDKNLDKDHCIAQR